MLSSSHTLLLSPFSWRQYSCSLWLWTVSYPMIIFTLLSYPRPWSYPWPLGTNNHTSSWIDIKPYALRTPLYTLPPYWLRLFFSFMVTRNPSTYRHDDNHPLVFSCPHVRLFLSSISWPITIITILKYPWLFHSPLPVSNSSGKVGMVKPGHPFTSACTWTKEHSRRKTSNSADRSHLNN